MSEKMSAGELEELYALNAKRTRTDHGWWTGESYSCSFGPVCDPNADERQTFRVPDAADDDGMMDVWAGPRDSEDDNRPLVAECGEPNDARFIAAIANAAPRLFANISALQREADGLREALTKLREACEPFQTEVSSWAPDFPPNGVALGDHDPALSVTWGDLLLLDIAAMDARAALNVPPQDRSSEEK